MSIVFLLRVYNMKIILQKWQHMVWFIVCLLSIDLVTKYLLYGRHRGVIDSVFNAQGAWWLSLWVPLLIVITCIVVVAMTYAVCKRIMPPLVYVFIVSWALWNLYDRLVLGWVRDWINIGIIPVFNLADIWITVWLCLFFYFEYIPNVWKKDI